MGAEAVYRGPELSGVVEARAVEPERRDPDNRRRQAVQQDVLPDHRWVAAELPVPERVTDYRFRDGRRREQAAGMRAQPQQLETAAVHQGAFARRRRRSERHVGADGSSRAPPGKRAGLREVAIVGVRRAVEARSLSGGGKDPVEI